MGPPPLVREPLSAVRGRDTAAVRPSARTRVAAAAGTAAAAAVLLLVYRRLSETSPVGSDSANAVLQGRSIADGNVLLGGWTLSGASFYVTDLPFYALFGALRGISPDVAHDAAAATYVLLVLAACFLAVGTARGTAAMARTAVTLLLLVAPAPGSAVTILLMGPFHAGTAGVLLVALLVLDRAGERPVGAAAVGVVLSLAVLSDALALYVGVLPIVAVSVLRLVSGPIRARSDLALLAAALLSVPASLVLAGLIGWLGGFATVSLDASLARVEDIPRNVALAVEGPLLLFGASFVGPTRGPLEVLAGLAHLAGLALVLVACGWALPAWRRGRQTDRVVQVLMAGMALNLAAYVFSNQAKDLSTSRYLVPVLAYGAVLAGRVGADRLWSDRRLRAAGAALALGYLVFLGASLGTPPAAQPETELAAFLERQHLTYGLGGYWQASSVTVHTRGRLRVRAIVAGGTGTHAYIWEEQGSWYDARRPGNDARFVVWDTSVSGPVDRRVVEASFGPPVGEFRVGRYAILVWDRNLLPDLPPLTRRLTTS
jgi:hypothetical protein